MVIQVFLVHHMPMPKNRRRDFVFSPKETIQFQGRWIIVGSFEIVDSLSSKGYPVVLYENFPWR
jgi:hypothetical protein